MRSSSRFCVTVGGLLALGGCGGKSTTKGVGDAVGTSPDAWKPGPCLTGPGVTTLVESRGSGLAVDGDHVLVLGSNEVMRVPIAGGTPVTLAQAADPYGLLVIGDNIYFTAMHDSGPVDFQGKQPSTTSLYVLPLAGGQPSIFLPTAPIAETWTTDGVSLFIASGQGVAMLTPPATTTVDLPFDGKGVIDAIAVNGDYVYVATQELAQNVPKNGAIQRLSKSGGAPQRIVADIGHPWNLVADDSGIYWAEDPPTGTYGNGHIMRAALDGTGITALSAHESTAMAIAGDNLYFESDIIGRMPKNGGDETTIVTGQTGEDFLKVAGGNLVWVNHASKALSDSTPTTVNTACIEPP